MDPIEYTAVPKESERKSREFESKVLSALDDINRRLQNLELAVADNFNTLLQQQLEQAKIAESDMEFLVKYLKYLGKNTKLLLSNMDEQSGTDEKASPSK